MLGSKIQVAKATIVQLALSCPSIDAAWAGAPRYLTPSRESEVSLYVRSADGVRRTETRGTLGAESFVIHLLAEVARRSTREREVEQLEHVEGAKWQAAGELDAACRAHRWGPSGIAGVTLEVEREDTGYTQEEYVGRVYLALNVRTLITPGQ